MLRRDLEIQELAPDVKETVRCLRDLACLYSRMGNYTSAEPLLQRAWKISQQTNGPEAPGELVTLTSLAELYRSMGDYAKAEAFQQRVLKIIEGVKGLEPPLVAAGLHNLGLFYRSMADYEKAEPLFKRALEIYERIYGPENLHTADSLAACGELCEAMGNYAKALPLVKRAVKIYEKTTESNRSEGLASCLHILASLFDDIGEYAAAEALYQQAVSIREEALGKDHPGTAHTLNNLAILYEHKSDYAKAEPLCRRALKIYEKTFGPEHPDTAMSLENLSLILLDEGKRMEATRMANRAQEARLKSLGNILSFTSEPERLAFMAGFHPYTLFASMAQGPQIAMTILRCKGVVLDSLAEDRLIGQASANPEDRILVGQMLSAKQRAYYLMLDVPKDLSETGRQGHWAERERAQAEAGRLEGELARHVAGLGRARRALSIKAEEMQLAIPKQAALIELLRYGHHLGATQWETRYGAVILSSVGEPKWLSLGTASAIATNLARYQVAARAQTRGEDFSSLLKQLYQQLWSPIERALQAGTKVVIISPDADLNFISFATLMAEDNQFLGQKYSIRYVSSGRDLLRQIKPSGSSDMLVYANPDFSGKGQQPITNSPTGLLTMCSVETRDFSDWQFSPLPGTANESALLESQAKKWNWPVKVFSGAAATEAQLYATKSPRILHLATHGFFLPDTETKDLASTQGMRGPGGTRPFSSDGEAWQLNPKPHVILKNPMHRSGLALAGAQATLEAWKRGEVPPTDNDGIVTAEEVGGLKLECTWLVALSACDTGTGEARSGEGVLGLRRGFIQAGAQNLLMTLWPVTDDDTPKLMADFYEAAHESGNAPKALADVQRDWLVKLRKERGLAAAVRIAGPFVMTSQGPVK